MKVNKKDLIRTKDLPVYSAVLKLVSAADAVMKAMQKDYKHTFGQDLVHSSFHLLTMVGKINRSVNDTKKRAELLEEFIDEYDVIAYLLKLCTEKKYISEQLYIDIIPIMSSIIRQANGWMKKTQADLHLHESQSPSQS